MSQTLQTRPGPLDLPDSLRASVLSAADDIEELRRLPDALVAELRGSGAFRLLTPREEGGWETGLATALRVYEEFGRLNTAVGWNVWNHNFGFLAAFLDESGVRRVWSAAGEPTLVNCTAPARAVATEGGILLTGRWKMVSGIDSADWLVAIAGVVEEDRPDGGFDIRYALLPRRELTVHDTWHVTGLRGTGTKSVEVDDAFVPAELTVPVTRPPRYGRPLFRIPSHYLVAAGCTAVLLGAAQAAVDELVRLAPGRHVLEGGVLADSATAQVRIATAETALHAARALLLNTAESFDATAESGGEPTLARRSALHAAQSHAALVCREVLMTMHELGGTAAVYLGSRFERAIRDGLVAAQHVNHSAQFLQDVGRVRLGRPPLVPLF